MSEMHFIYRVAKREFAEFRSKM